MNTYPERIGLLYLKSGGGHVSAARTIAKGLNDRYKEKVEVYQCNPVSRKRKLTSFLLEQGYGIASLKIPGIWIFLYDISRLPFVRTLWSAVTYNVVKERLTRFIIKNRITKIVVLHFLLINPVYKVLRDCGLKLPVCTVVTDPFTAHPMWFSRGRGRTIVFSKQLKTKALQDYGLAPGKVHVFPPIIAAGFHAPLSGAEKASFKREKGFSPDLPLTLFVGGGEGAPGALIFLRKWMVTRPQSSLAVVCGKDVRGRKKLEQFLVRKNGKNRGIVIFGFINFMAELMNAADIIAAKAGPATILEAASLGKPLFIYRYIYGQERGNVDFAIKKKVGRYTPNLKKLVRELDGAIRKGACREDERDGMPKKTITTGVNDVCRFLYEFS